MDCGSINFIDVSGGQFGWETFDGQSVWGHLLWSFGMSLVVSLAGTSLMASQFLDNSRGQLGPLAVSSVSEIF